MVRRLEINPLVQCAGQLYLTPCQDIMGHVHYKSHTSKFIIFFPLLKRCLVEIVEKV
jgi:hypothetical protein